MPLTTPNPERAIGHRIEFDVAYAVCSRKNDRLVDHLIGVDHDGSCDIGAVSLSVLRSPRPRHRSAGEPNRLFVAEGTPRWPPSERALECREAAKRLSHTAVTLGHWLTTPPLGPDVMFKLIC